MTLERNVKAAVKRVLKEMGAYQFWPVQTGMGAPTLDCLCCYRGRFFAIETKAPGKKPTPRQHQTIAAIHAAGGIIFLFDTTDRAKIQRDLEFYLWSGL